MACHALRHDAFVYDSDDCFVERMAPFLESGLRAGEPAVAVTTSANCDLLRDALGDAAERISFEDRDAWYGRPASAIARYDKTMRDHARAGAPAIRVVGEVQFGATPREWAEWMAYESILNHAFAGRPAWIVCPYDERALPDVILEGALRTHPKVLDEDWEDSPHYGDPGELVRSLAPAPAALEQLRSVPLVTDARGFRHQLHREMAAAGAADGQIEDMLLAAGEILANALAHGIGAPRMRVGLVGERFVCEISDDGPGLDDPLAGYVPPSEGGRDGAGLWVARQLTSRLDLIPRADGLTVRLWI